MKHLALTPNLNCKDLPRSIRFYQDVVGLELHRTVPDQAPFVFAWMKSPGSDVAVFLNDRAAAEQPAEPSAAMSLYFVIDDLAATFARAKQHGARIVKEPFDQFYGMREFLCQDPDGFLLIFAQELHK